MERSLVFLGLVLIIGIPILTITLGEVSECLSQRGNPLGKFFQDARTYLLPPLAILLATRMISRFLAVGYADISIAIAETVFWLAFIYVIVLRKFVLRVHVPTLLFQVTRILAFLVIGGYVFINIWGVDLLELATFLGIASIVTALALQNTISSLVSGFLLILERPLRKGDWIRVGDIEGEIIEINWRAVRLRSGGSVVIVPNVGLFEDTIQNYTLSHQLYADSLSVSFSYEDPPNRVRQALKSAALTIEGIVTDPPPDVITKSYDESVISYELTFYVKDFKQKSKIYSDLMTRIYYVAKRHKLKIQGKDYEQDIAQSDIIDFLRSLPYFVGIDREAIARLTQKVAVEYYGIGEQVLQIGTPNQGFYFILEGHLQLSVMDSHHHQREVAKLVRGDFFGEMALLPREPSSVSARVIEDIKVIVIDYVSMYRFLEESPQFALEINQFINKRKKTADMAKLGV
ncbi:MAG: mechanosensitive ion channel family protein [Leptolyngbyaceae cyanobacterium MO_188.B28]|nr:mechanosensitive ion channel family protein [Leptolyngbyaceae cyanobacterium MO_188.B28]